GVQDLGGVVTVTEPGDRPKFDVPTTRRRNLSVAAQFVVVVAAIMYFLYAQTTLPMWARFALGAAILAVVCVWGRLYALRGNSLLSASATATDAKMPENNRASRGRATVA